MKKVMMGVLLLVTVACIILSALGVSISAISGFSVLDIMLSVILLGMVVTSVMKGHYELIPFPFMIMFFFLEDDIARLIGRSNENILNNWLVFGCAILTSIAIEMIFSPVKKKRRHNKGSSFAIGGDDGVKFGSQTKYIDCNAFKYYYYKVRMGDSSIYFTNAEQYEGDGELCIDCSLGNIEVHVPQNWNIDCNIHASMANVESPDPIGCQDAPTLRITGEAKMGNVEIIYD